MWTLLVLIAAAAAGLCFWSDAQQHWRSRHLDAIAQTQVEFQDHFLYAILCGVLGTILMMPLALMVGLLQGLLYLDIYRWLETP